MKRRKTLFIFYLLYILTSCYRPDAKDSFEDLQKLSGNWTSAEGVMFNENWKIVNDTFMIGTGFSLKGNDTAFKEELKIFLNEDSTYYAAKVEHNKGFVFFSLREAGRNKWKFVNEKHDYPNIIQYELVNDTLLQVFTANIRGNKKVEFILKREK